MESNFELVWKDRSPMDATEFDELNANTKITWDNANVYCEQEDADGDGVSNYQVLK